MKFLRFALLGVLFASLLAACRDRSDLRQVIHGFVAIQEKWIEIKPPMPLRREREASQIELDFSSTYRIDPGGQGVRLPDGTLITIEIELIDDNGGRYPLSFSARGKDTLSFSYKSAFPPDRTFPMVRIRSSRPLECHQIVWVNYNIRDHW